MLEAVPLPLAPQDLSQACPGAFLFLLETGSSLQKPGNSYLQECVGLLWRQTNSQVVAPDSSKVITQRSLCMFGEESYLVALWEFSL